MDGCSDSWLLGLPKGKEIVANSGQSTMAKHAHMPDTRRTRHLILQGVYSALLSA